MAAVQDRSVPRIVVGVDGSPSSRQALRWAVRQAELTGGAVDAVIAWQYPPYMAGFGFSPSAMLDTADYAESSSKALADAVADTVSPDSPVSIRQLVVEDNAARALLKAAEGADMLVVGSRGHGGFAGALLGSVSQHCVYHARCPVIVIRGRTDDHPSTDFRP
jgi:nucleotide-binding universal stress UspA family protein